ncbi:MAG TPA: ATP-binding protein, partial [Candidatus Limnocylindrales bacterium]|nr:ATP-binding protein [Candidatus Limnocylindrales bacterium]
VAAMNPCRCGFAGDAVRECSCLPESVARYRGRLSGPLRDRIALRVAVARVPYEELRERGARDGSRAVRERVLAARERMSARLGRSPRRSNAEMTVAETRRDCHLDEDGEALAREAVRSRRFSARGYHRLLRVARTIADLAGAERIRAADLALAILLRGEA